MGTTPSGPTAGPASRCCKDACGRGRRAWSRSGGRGRATAGRRAGARQKRDGGTRRRGDRAAHRAGERRFRPDGPSETSRGRGAGLGAGDSTRADGAVASRSRRSGRVSSTNTSRIFFRRLSNAPISRDDAPALRLDRSSFMFGSSARSLRHVLPPENIMLASAGATKRRRPDRARRARFLHAEKRPIKRSAENPIGRKFSESRTRAAKTAETSTANQSLKKCDLNKSPNLAREIVAAQLILCVSRFSFASRKTRFFFWRERQPPDVGKHLCARVSNFGS